MFQKKRFPNPPDAKEHKVPLAAIRQLIRETKILHRSIQPHHISWNNSANLTRRLEEISSKDYLCWIGHATFLMQLNNKRILIDPFFSENAGPLKWLGPKRFLPPALKTEELPRIDYIYITHNHYDHLDRPFLKKIARLNNPKIFVPSGLYKKVKKWGFNNIVETHWHQSYEEHGIKLTALPAYHYSRRGLFDYKKSWWCSYAITTTQLKLFHSGDTGYGEVFKEIGKQYGPFDYAMLGIGAYQPPEVMKTVHTNPEEAAQIAADIQAKIILPMHWGSIVLSPEPLTEPMTRLTTALKKLSHSQPITIGLEKVGDLIVL
jgi:L-ascorbate metabolism protein UlaG (beta-lactamase superfamily)